MLLAVLLLVTGMLTVKLINNVGSDSNRTEADGVAHSKASSHAPSPSKSSPSASPPSHSPSPSPTEKPVEHGNGQWSYAKAPKHSETFGDSGTLLKFNIAVEGDIDQQADDFADIVTETLSDKRSWIGGHQWRFQQVDKGWADFTVYLASPKTRSQLCGAEDSYTSCRNGNSVVLNLDRWIKGVPHWKASLDSYRHYVVNHEVGHRLGEPHMVCPKKGKPSPVMAQQTIELRGCKPNAWPYVDGKYLTGPNGEYDS